MSPDRTPPPDPAEPAAVVPREFGRDGVSGLVDVDRAMRARDVSRPDPDDVAAALRRADELVARATRGSARR